MTGQLDQLLRDVYLKDLPPPARYKPLGGWYHVRLLDPEEETEGGLALPDAARAANNTDGEVLDVGPGFLHHDTLLTLQSAPGERIVFQGHSFKPFPDRHREGFVHDKHLVARVLDYGVQDWLQPCWDWVALKPDPLDRIKELKSGICVATYSLPGAEARELANQGDPDWKYLTPKSQAERPRSGVVLATGPGRMNKQGRHLGQLWELLGQRVHWAAHVAGVELFGPEGRVLFLKEGDLLGVEED